MAEKWNVLLQECSRTECAAFKAHPEHSTLRRRHLVLVKGLLFNRPDTLFRIRPNDSNSIRYDFSTRYNSYVLFTTIISFFVIIHLLFRINNPYHTPDSVFISFKLHIRDCFSCYFSVSYSNVNSHRDQPFHIMSKCDSAVLLSINLLFVSWQGNY